MIAEQEILEEVEGFSASDREALRDVCRRDLYVLSCGVLGYKDMAPELHGIGSRFIVGHPKRRRLILWPRAHLKTTEFSVADSVRLALEDPSDCQILIASETATLAQKILREIKGHFESNELLRSLFPEVLPPRFSGPGVQWGTDAASVNRGRAYKDPTWQAVGVGGASVGAHFTRIKCDDLIGLEAYRSPAAMDRAVQWLDYIEPLLVNQETDAIDFIGTRWAKNDLYSKVIGNYGEALAVHTRTAIEIDPDGKPYIIFPALHTWEEYERIQRTNPALWYAQYENNPIASGAKDFDIGLVGFFRFSSGEDFVVMPSGKRWAVTELDRVLTADPNSGAVTAEDEAAIAVSGVSPDDEVFVLESWGGRVSPSAFVDQIYRMARRWRVRVVGIERAGQQNTDHYFQLKADREGYHVKVEELKPRGRHKEDRIRAALEPIIRSGLLYTLPSQGVLRSQIADFPGLELWDQLDALAYGPELWRRGQRKEEEGRRRNVVQKLMAMRNPVTGY